MTSSPPPTSNADTAPSSSGTMSAAALNVELNRDRTGELTHKDESLKAKESRKNNNNGKRINWSRSKSFQYTSTRITGLGDMHSPRFKDIVRAIGGSEKKTLGTKSLSHKYNSKGVPLPPFWKSEALVQMEEVKAMIKNKFDKAKEEVNHDLSLFASDLLNMIRNANELHQELKNDLEKLLLVAHQCANMSVDDFWCKCQSIVRDLDNQRRDLPTGAVKQAHTRLLFILTRCTRLVQVYEKNGYYEEQHILFEHILLNDLDH